MTSLIPPNEHHAVNLSIGKPMVAEYRLSGCDCDGAEVHPQGRLPAHVT